MLKEKSIYKDELPVNVVVANIEEYPIHFHDDMEVVYVLEGTVILRNRVTALHRVNITARVSGEIKEVAFADGALVKKVVKRSMRREAQGSG